MVAQFRAEPSGEWMSEGHAQPQPAFASSRGCLPLAVGSHGAGASTTCRLRSIAALLVMMNFRRLQKPSQRIQTTNPHKIDILGGHCEMRQSLAHSDIQGRVLSLHGCHCRWVMSCIVDAVASHRSSSYQSHEPARLTL